MTFYCEAIVVATGQLMADSGLTADQVEHLRGAEDRGVITGLVVDQDIELSAAFRSSKGVDL